MQRQNWPVGTNKKNVGQPAAHFLTARMGRDGMLSDEAYKKEDE